jgi:hypothetical protein
LLGSLPETVFFTFLPCLKNPVLFLSFFFLSVAWKFIRNLFFLLFSYIATYVHAWNFTRNCSFSIFLPMSVAT